MNRPLIGNRNSWASFEKCVLEAFNLALKMLCDKSSIPKDEDLPGQDNLNRRLFICLHKVVREWEERNEDDFPYPFNLKRNHSKQPDLDNEEIVKDFEPKIPDFQWGFIDRLGISDNEYFKNYEIECKRLGTELAKKYVINGINRFTKNTHCYGQYTSSGMMIGYVQDMELQAILDEVNSNVMSVSLPGLLLSTEGWASDVSRLDHRLDRPDVEPTPFDLRHLWVDLRHHYKKQLMPSNTKQTEHKKRRSKKPKLSSGF